MAHVIKRYTNRKLYDTSAKQYVKLEELAALVRAGEEVKIIENRTGDDITSQVLSKVISEMISESAREQKSHLPVAVLSEMIQKRSDAVVEYFKQGLAASVRTVKGMSAREDIKMVIQRMIEDSMQFLIAKMN